jgi:hypothetical protein
MARTPTVYRWDDPGAPDLNAVMPTANDKDRLFIHTILKACLVDGYGSKQAAGWAMPHEEIVSDGCRFVLENKASSGSLLYEGGVFSGGVSDLKSNTIWACSSVPNMATPVNAWSHKVKYEARNNGGSGFHKSGLYQGRSCDAWVVIANENTAVFISGRSNVEFDLASSAGAAVSIVGEFMFGAMHGGSGGVTNPTNGNFYLAGGGQSSYANSAWYAEFGGVVSSFVDIIGLAKTKEHTFKYSKPAFSKTYSPLSAWLPIPFIYMQYGPSSPDGDASSRLHFAIALPSIRKLLLHPYGTVDLNTFMTSNSFQYGKSFSYQGGGWVAIKAPDDIVQMFSLAPAEWGA